MIASAEAAAYHAADLDRRSWIFNDGLLAWLRAGRGHGAARYQDACRQRLRLVEEMRTIMTPFDAFVLPTSPVAATPIADGFAADETRRWRNTGPFLVLDTPAISVPCGLTARGLPIGLQIVGKPFREADLLRHRPCLRAGVRLDDSRFAARGRPAAVSALEPRAPR